mgnify:CR=1 FL=1
MGCQTKTVRRIRNRFLDKDLDAALFDRPRPGQRQRLDAADEAFLIATDCSDVPQGHHHWELTMLCGKLKRQRGKTAGRETVRQGLRRQSLKPWRGKNVVHSTWALSRVLLSHR